jgi:hypothetical protein
MSRPNSINQSLPMDEFWAWLALHYNCILRAGGPGFVLYDQPDVHWHLGADPDGIFFVQLIRGKETAAEFYFNPADVHYVQTSAGEEEQMLFECIGVDEGQTTPLCHFLLTHAYDAEELPTARTWTH